MTGSRNKRSRYLVAFASTLLIALLLGVQSYVSAHAGGPRRLCGRSCRHLRSSADVTATKVGKCPVSHRGASAGLGWCRYTRKVDNNTLNFSV